MWKTPFPAALLAALLCVCPHALWTQQPVPPRLDRVSVLGTRFEPGDSVTTWLYVQGANVDENAQVLIDGVVHPTAPHRALQNLLYGIKPETLGYPILMYRALVAAPGTRAAGSTLSVMIRNADGQTTEALTYRLPTDSASLDSDGDDIPDVWEVRGYDPNGDGVLEVDLPRLGADPYRPDIFLEVDIMEGLEHRPTAAVFETVQGAFATAPIINPRGLHGINLVIDATGKVEEAARLAFAPPPGSGATDFHVLKARNFDEAARGRLYHYCIWGSDHAQGASGESDKLEYVDASLDAPGDDCMVTFDGFPEAFHTVRIAASTLMHELGHNLKQRHGGESLAQNVPTYNSVMSYSWQLRTGYGPFERQKWPVCTPLFYGRSNAVEDGGVVPADVSNVIDYSEGMGRALKEDELDETTGLCNGVPVDWIRDKYYEKRVKRDLDGDGWANGTVRDYPNWTRLDFSGPRRNGRYHPDPR